jgi:hypothetical protein
VLFHVLMILCIFGVGDVGVFVLDCGGIDEDVMHVFDSLVCRNVWCGG